MRASRRFREAAAPSPAVRHRLYLIGGLVLVAAVVAGVWLASLELRPAGARTIGQIFCASPQPSMVIDGISQ